MFPALFKSSEEIRINLLPKDPFSQSPLGRFLNWALSVGRYIVVFTEMIVILTFLSRFTLDRQLTDLNESILKKQALLESYANLEEEVRLIQEKASFITTLQSQEQVVGYLDYLLLEIPKDVFYEDIVVQQDRFIVSGYSYSRKSLSEFVNKLKSNHKFTQVSIDQIESANGDARIKFIIRTEYSPRKSSQTLN